MRGHTVMEMGGWGGGKDGGFRLSCRFGLKSEELCGFCGLVRRVNQLTVKLLEVMWSVFISSQRDGATNNNRRGNEVQVERVR